MRPSQAVEGQSDIHRADGRVVGADRILVVLKHLAGHPEGITLDDLTSLVAAPKSTIHRALGTLCRAGFAQHVAHGRYVLGDEFVRLAFDHYEARPDRTRVQPLLRELADRFGETTHYAILDGGEVVYRAKADPYVGAARLTSTIGGRNPAHATGVGKLLLAFRLATREDVVRWMGGESLERRTPSTRCTADELWRDLRLTRRRGYATDDGENESGVNCIAFPLHLASSTEVTGAVSVSALAYRTPLSALVARVDEISDRLIAFGNPASSRPMSA